jgi:zinc transport system ATP-binding protein
MQGPSIEFKNVSLNLGNTQILEDVSFSISPAMIHCIIGSNGGGKTSLIRCMLGQMPHSGSIEIEWDSNRTIGYVPQQLEIDKTLPVSVIDFLTMATQRRPAFLGQSKRLADKTSGLLEQFGLTSKRNDKLGSLSGGERQRVVFAQAMIPAPALLVLDEPMTGLDVAGGEMILAAVRQFASDGGTVVWINHDINQVNEIADKLTYVNKTIMLDGVPAEVLQTGVANQLFPTLSFEDSSPGDDNVDTDSVEVGAVSKEVETVSKEVE